MYLLQLVDAERGECLWIKKCRADDINTLREWGALPTAPQKYVKKVKVPTIFAVTNSVGMLHFVAGIPEVHKAFGSKAPTTYRYLGWLVRGECTEVQLPYPAGRLYVRLATPDETEQYLKEHPLHGE